MHYKIERYYKRDDSWQFVKENRNDLFDFFDRGYMFAGLGHFMGCDRASGLYKNSNCLKIATYDGEWVAMSVYTGYAGGYKCVGITATTNPSLRYIGKEAVKTIIKEDIGLTMDFYWVECDGAVEHLYKKFGGYEIPSVYVYCFFQNTKHKPIPIKGDPYGYYRSFGVDENRQWRRKVIFGFNSQETYDLVTQKSEQEINDILKEAGYYDLREDESPLEKKLKIAHKVIGCFYELRYDEGWYDLPDNAIDALSNSINFIKKHIDDNTCPEYMLYDMQDIVDIGEEILDTSTKMELHKL